MHRSEPLLRLAVLVVVSCGALAPPRARAQVVSESMWATSGTVHALVEHAGTIYVGGTFTRVGPSVGCFVPVDPQSGDPIAGFPRVDGHLGALCPDGSGGWYLGGDFAHVGGIPRAGLAHVEADGSVSAWDPGLSGPNPGTSYWVEALAMSGSVLYVGGAFVAIGGQPRSNIGAVDAVTGTPTSFDPGASGTAHPAVVTLVVDGSTVYAGGSFTTIGGQSRTNLAALDVTTAAATAWDPDADAPVQGLLLSGALVYAGGSFTNVGGQSRNHVAALDAVSGTATPWDPDAGGAVYIFAKSGPTIYLGGSFTTIGGQQRNSIGAVDAATGAVTAWDPDASSTVRELAVDGSTVWLGGSFDIVGGETRPFLAAFDAATGMATGWNPGADGTVTALAVDGSTVYVGGTFTTLGGQPRSRIGAVDAVTGAVTAWDPDADGAVEAIAVDGTTVYAVGSFDVIGGQPRPMLAALDMSLGAATSWTPSIVGVNTKSMNCLLVVGSTVYTGGNFAINGSTTTFRNVAAFDAVSGAPTSWRPDTVTPGQVYALALDGGRLIVGGDFSSVGLQTRNGIAALDLATGGVTSWNPNALYTNGFSADVYSLVVDGATVYAGGQYDEIGGQPRRGFAALDAVTGAATAWDAALFTKYNPPNVNALALSGSTLYAGGWFATIGGFPHGNVAAVSGDATAAPVVAAAAGVLRLDSAPNPFRSATRIRFVLPDAAPVRLDVFDVAGRLVATPLDGVWREAGSHEVTFRARGLASGVYVCRLQTGQGVSTRKLLIRR